MSSDKPIFKSFKVNYSAIILEFNNPMVTHLIYSEVSVGEFKDSTYIYFPCINNYGSSRSDLHYRICYEKELKSYPLRFLL